MRTSSALKELSHGLQETPFLDSNIIPFKKPAVRRLPTYEHLGPANYEIPTENLLGYREHGENYQEVWKLHVPGVPMDSQGEPLHLPAINELRKMGPNKYGPVERAALFGEAPFGNGSRLSLVEDQKSQQS